MRFIRVGVVVALACAPVVLAACGSTEIDEIGDTSKITNDGGSGADALSQFTISLSPTTIAVGHGESGSTTVTVARGAGFTGPVSITVSGLTSGVFASALTIPAGSTSGSLTFVASGDAPVGGTTRGIVSGVDPNGAVGAQVPVNVVVGGSAGSLDTTFGTDGKVLLDLGGQAADTAHVIVVQPDGKMLVAGETDTPFGAGVITRMNAVGSLDTSFGQGGKVFMTVADTVTSMALQTDGKIVVTTDYGFTIARYLPNGTLDPSFNHGAGILQLFAPQSGSAEGVAIQPDGKIVVVGSVYATPSDGLYITRRNADGSADYTFGQYGVLTPLLPGIGTDGWSVALETTGSVTNSIAIGATNSSSSAASGYTLAVLKLKGTDGSLDTTFNTTGYVLDVHQWGGASASVAFQPDGKLLACGASALGIEALRFGTDGSLDTTFDTDGIAALPFGNTNLAYEGMALQPDGKIVALAVQYGGSPAFAGFSLARINADGSPDTTAFNGNESSFVFDFGTEYDWARGLTIDSTGRIFAVGSSKIGTDVDFAVARLTSAGVLDESFGTHGKITSKIGTGNDYAFGSTPLPDGSLLVTGDSYNGSAYDFVLVKLTPAGVLDASFGVGGIVRIVSGGDGFAVALQDDGKIVAITQTKIARFSSSGTLDATFGTGGLVTLSQPGFALAIHDGKIFVTGSGMRIEAHDEATGALVGSFGSGGVTSSPYAVAANVSEYGFGLAFDSSGNVVAAGKYDDETSGIANPADTLLLRYDANGTLDPSFGTNGISRTDFEPIDYARSIAIGSDGHIVVGGQSIRADLSGYDMAIQRFLPNGTRDTSFGGAGWVATEFSVWDDAFSVLVQPDGKIVGSGSSIRDTSITSAQFALARYNTDGSLDSNFGANGKIITAFAPGVSEAFSLVRRPDGRLVQVGYAESVRRDYDIAVAQYWP